MAFVADVADLPEADTGSAPAGALPVFLAQRASQSIGGGGVRFWGAPGVPYRSTAAPPCFSPLGRSWGRAGAPHLWGAAWDAGAPHPLGRAPDPPQGSLEGVWRWSVPAWDMQVRAVPAPWDDPGTPLGRPSSVPALGHPWDSTAVPLLGRSPGNHQNAADTPKTDSTRRPQAREHSGPRVIHRGRETISQETSGGLSYSSGVQQSARKTVDTHGHRKGVFPTTKEEGSGPAPPEHY